MSGKINFILGFHNHIPNGAAQEEFEDQYNHKIRPLVSTLYQFPRINVVIHYSGVLLHWVERHHPELFVLLEDLLARKQVELLGGGFYEPMMPLLPLADRIGQIEMLTTYLRRQLGRRPQGCWLPIFSWEQNLVGPLGACGMNYTFLDESYFQAAGAQERQGYFEPCITEDQGRIITVFPVFSSLSHKEPIAMLENFLEFDGIDALEGPVTVFPAFPPLADISGEKAEAGYSYFFNKLSGASERIEFTTPGRIFRSLRRLKKLYFTGNSVPDGSAGHNDALPACPRQFLTDYPEAGLIYAKMIHTRVLINQLRGDKARKHTALEALWKAQDSALFCRAGLANAPVRKAAFHALLEAEYITRGKDFFPSLSAFDYDLDGEDEYVFKDEKLNCYIKKEGAFLFELDYFPKSWNYQDAFIPTSELPGKSERKAGHSVFIDYLVPGKELPKINWQGIPGARFCGDESFIALEFDRVHRQVTFRLPPKKGIPLGNIELKKTWNLKRNILTLQYELSNTGSDTEWFTFIPAVDLSFSGGNEDFVRIMALRGSSKEKLRNAEEKEFFVKETGGIEFRDIKSEVVLSPEANRHFDARIFTVETKNALGLEEYKFNCIMPLLPISLETGKNWDISFSLKISS